MNLVQVTATLFGLGFQMLSNSPCYLTWWSTKIWNTPQANKELADLQKDWTDRAAQQRGAPKEQSVSTCAMCRTKKNKKK